ncbi:MAG TPA: DUF4198 domain-containing protein [Mucilaginibacter sp.]|jgi:hypothetical protein|nr:DUF4198 domain-containing protein [Mucilaginibacter sp.]
MKYIYFFISCFVLMASGAGAQDNILLPERFYVKKGEAIKVHLINVSQFIKQDEVSLDPNKFQKFTLGVGKKAEDLVPGLKAPDTTTTIKFEKEGLNLLAVTMKVVNDDIERDDFTKILDDEGLNDLSNKVKNGSKDNFRERYTWYMKSLIKVDDKINANDFEKSTGQDFEITLKDNPYKGGYGDDITASVMFKGEPAVNAVVLFYIKTADGNVFVQHMNVDKQGLIYFKLSREGTYMLRSMHMEASKDKSADYDAWLATYTFAFSNTTDVPNSYKSFGIGNPPGGGRTGGGRH